MHRHKTWIPYLNKIEVSVPPPEKKSVKSETPIVFLHFYEKYIQLVDDA